MALVKFETMHTVLTVSIPAPQKFLIPKENSHNIAFSFVTTHFGGAGIYRGNTV